MARSRSRSGGGAKKKGADRQAKSRKAAAPVAEVEVVEEEGGMSIDDGIPIITGLLLLVAFVLVDYVLGVHYGEGMFFKP
jgi:hypothetical protein